MGFVPGGVAGAGGHGSRFGVVGDARCGTGGAESGVRGERRVGIPLEDAGEGVPGDRAAELDEQFLEVGEGGAGGRRPSASSSLSAECLATPSREVAWAATSGRGVRGRAMRKPCRGLRRITTGNSRTSDPAAQDQSADRVVHPWRIDSSN